MQTQHDFTSVYKFENKKNEKLVSLFYIAAFKKEAYEHCYEEVYRAYIFFHLVNSFAIDNMTKREYKRRVKEDDSLWTLYEIASFEHWNLTWFIFDVFKARESSPTTMEIIEKHIDIYHALEEQYSICGDRLFHLLHNNNWTIVV